MARPEQGQLYTVKPNDTIHTIERAAYGRVVNRVVQANYDLLKNRGISDEGLPILYAGDSLFIPIYKNRYFDQPITADFDTQLLVKLNGVELPGALAGRISRAMNRIASGFVFDVPFDITSREELDLFRPYTYHTAQLYIGGELYITAVASNWTYSASSDGTIATIECRTTPGEMLNVWACVHRIPSALECHYSKSAKKSRHLTASPVIPHREPAALSRVNPI